MEPGRELDALIAEKVMECSVSYIIHSPEPRCGCRSQHHNGRVGEAYIDHGQLCVLRAIPEYSTNIAAAWEVVEKMRENQTVGIHEYSEGWEVVLIGPGCAVADGQADTAPHAICLAALQVVGHTIDTEEQT